MPPYKPLLPYFDAVKDLLAKYNTLEFNPKKGDALLAGEGLQEAGRHVAGAGRQAAHARDHRLRRPSGPAIGPVLSQMLKRHGVAASLSLPPDFDSRFQKGEFVGSIYGHGGSIREPYDTLRLYQGKSIAVPGAHLVNFSRWKNPEFDKIVDEVYVTDPKNVAKLKELFRAAMEIWLPDLPDIQLVQNYHRIPMNTTALEELADRGEPLHQRRVLAPDLQPGAVERAVGAGLNPVPA